MSKGNGKTTTESLYESILPGVGDISRDINMEDFEFFPWTGRILVKRFRPDTESVGGLSIPKEAQQEKNWGPVVKLPERNPPEGVSVGDLILFLDGAGTLAGQAFGADFVLLDYTGEFDNDVLGIFRPKGLKSGRKVD